MVGHKNVKRRARDITYWPNMASDIEDLARPFVVCKKHRHQNSRFRMLSYEIPSMPWHVVGADLCYHKGQEYLILVVFYLFFFQVKELQKLSATPVARTSSEVFVAHGLPALLCSDNGPPL